jgi:hypothetical protein
VPVILSEFELVTVSEVIAAEALYRKLSIPFQATAGDADSNCQFIKPCILDVSVYVKISATKLPAVPPVRASTPGKKVSLL